MSYEVLLAPDDAQAVLAAMSASVTSVSRSGGIPPIVALKFEPFVPVGLADLSRRDSLSCDRERMGWTPNTARRGLVEPHQDLVCLKGQKTMIQFVVKQLDSVFGDYNRPSLSQNRE